MFFSNLIKKFHSFIHSRHFKAGPYPVLGSENVYFNKKGEKMSKDLIRITPFRKSLNFS